MASVNRWNPEGVRAIMSVLTGTGEFEGGSLDAAILDADTTADTQWDTVTNLGAYTDLSEFTGSGYSRKTVANVAVSTTGTQVFVTFDPIEWAALGAATPNAEHVLLYVSKSGAATDADRVPVYLGDVVSQPDGGLFTAPHPTGGLAILETDPI